MILLSFRLKYEIKKLGLPVDFNIDFRGYSKTYNARYDPNRQLVILYDRKKSGERYDLDNLLRKVLHEAIHHYQWYHNEDYYRRKGVMHDEEFYIIENRMLNKLEGCERGVTSVS